MSSPTLSIGSCHLSAIANRPSIADWLSRSRVSSLLRSGVASNWYPAAANCGNVAMISVSSIRIVCLNMDNVQSTYRHNRWEKRAERPESSLQFQSIPLPENVPNKLCIIYGLRVTNFSPTLAPVRIVLQIQIQKLTPLLPHSWTSAMFQTLPHQCQPLQERSFNFS